MAISVRLRFEIFKRDDFRCMYCGRRSPDVVLEVDHIQPVCEGGSDDPLNLTTSCWDCNHGKSGVPLAVVMTGEDPHDRALLILERQRQVEEYNTVLARARAQRESDTWELLQWWLNEQGYNLKAGEKFSVDRSDYNWLFSALEWCPKEVIRNFMSYALNRRMTKNLRYVAGCARNWRYEHAADKDFRGADSEY